MIVMLDTTQPFDQCEKELGYPCEQLFTPLTRYKPQRPDARFAIDNGAYSQFEKANFESLLRRELPRAALCRFVAVPDIPFSARRTLEVFEHWKTKIHPSLPLALVCQDGQQDLPIPWDEIAAIFIGGSTDWKCGPHAAACIKAAKAMGKYVHAGRVNTPGRLEYMKELGVDSIDGTGLSRYTWMREDIYRSEIEPKLSLT